jgi:xanthine dehydrogenase accessory factor
MRDVLSELIVWSEEDKPVALATVIETWGSAPRPAGSNMAISEAGEMAGSVSGGCVEGAVVEAALEVLKSGQPRLLQFGVADETAWDVGLSCGGNIQVFVRPINPKVVQTWKEEDKRGKTLASLMVIAGPQDILGKEIALHEDKTTVEGDLEPQALDYAQREISHAKPQRFQPDDSVLKYFLNVHRPLPTLIVVGGVHIAIPLVSLAKTLGYRTVVVDPRRMFGSQTRFPNVDQLIQAWPEAAFEDISLTSSSAVAMLTHDPKIDDPALKIVLRSAAFYIGALGSRKTHAKRRQRLLDEGMSESQLERLHAPIGLNLGGRAPEEIALAIMAEIVQARHL